MKLKLLAFVILALVGCGKPLAARSKSMRIHNQNIKGVAHALPYYRGERYCSQCHGVALSGGSGAAPGCYTCHGKLWLDQNAQDVRYPESHVIQKGAYFHAPGLKTPLGDCDRCHGAQLIGAGAQGAPPCLLCHEKLWD